ncbi:hypothetical protein QFC20_005863 [Naganishia adeliensis]|uniref:Uncharacterized protein n=1 Tax=Naganishia adeliensis TaxID=92952 RepID=A0ACC2VIC2_9TREE|nr:hypothetical protein QFC20_005863 [Naganishia adeliensis]
MYDRSSPEGAKGVFSAPIQAWTVDGWILDDNRRNMDARAPFMIISTTGEILQTTVKPEREGPIAFQIAVRWLVPSKRGIPDGSWNAVSWREIVATSEMHFTVETVKHLMNEADKLVARDRYHREERTETNALSQFRSLPTIRESNIEDDNEVRFTWDELSEGSYSEWQGGNGIGSPGDQPGADFPDAAMETLILGLIKDNLHRLRLWISKANPNVREMRRPAILEEALAIMEPFLLKGHGIEAIADPINPNKLVYQNGPKVVRVDFADVFKNETIQPSTLGNESWHFVGSETRLTGKNATVGSMKNKVVLVFELSVTFQVAP